MRRRREREAKAQVGGWRVVAKGGRNLLAMPDGQPGCNMPRTHLCVLPLAAGLALGATPKARACCCRANPERATLHVHAAWLSLLPMGLCMQHAPKGSAPSQPR